jgi:hypothetical protein
MREGMTAVPIAVRLAGVKLVTLNVGDGGDGIGSDQADWAEARFELVDGTEVWLGDLAESMTEGLYLDHLHPVQLEVLEKTSAKYMDVVVSGARKEHGMVTHPTRAGRARVAYVLPAGVAALSGSVAINDTAAPQPGGGARTPVTFRILGDGRELWKSRPVQKSGDPQAFDVRLAGCKRLELAVDCDDPFAAHAVWIDPFLSPPGGKKPPKSARTPK